MLGYRIKQTVFILAGLVVFFMTWERFVEIVVGRRSGDLDTTHVITEMIWLAICLGGGEVVAQITGGMNDADVKPLSPSPPPIRAVDAPALGIESRSGVLGRDAVKIENA
jgi:hypothetical protein